MSTVRVRVVSLLAAVTALLLPSLPSQTATELNMGATISVDASTTPPTWRFSWWGRSGYQYLVQVSLDLQTWSYLPETNPSGEDAPITVVVPIDFDSSPDGSGPKLFFRALEFDPASQPQTGNALPDAWEQFYFGTTEVDPGADPDHDGLTNLQEYQRGTNPIVADTDGDGMSDGWEVSKNLNPKSAADAELDPDGDGLTNRQEYLAEADPHNKDSDGDGLTDGLEVSLKSKASEADANAEIVFLPELLSVPNGTTDVSATDISNSGYIVGFADDYAARWSPQGVETGLVSGSNYSYAQAVNDSGIAVGETSYDSNYSKAMFWPVGASPFRFGGTTATYLAWDINSAGVTVGTDVLGSGAFKRLVDGTLVSLAAPSGYRSPEAHAVNDAEVVVGRVRNSTTSAVRGAKWVGGNVSLLPAETVDATGINSAGDIVGATTTNGFCYHDGELTLLPSPATGSTTVWLHAINLPGLILGQERQSPRRSLLWQPAAGGGWQTPVSVADRLITDLDPNGFNAYAINDHGELAGEYRDPILGTSQAVRFRPVLRPRLLVDANRDGAITPGAADVTSSSAPFKFWINNDDDDIVDQSITGVYEEVEDDDRNITNVQSEDWRNNVLDTPRDLEDFARIWINTQGLNDSIKSGQLFVGLKWKNATGTPAIKLYRSKDVLGSADYLFNSSAAAQQALATAIIDARYPDYAPDGNFVSDHTLIEGSEVFILPTVQFSALSESSSRTAFLFEGCKSGAGQLAIVILKKDGTNYVEIGEGPGVWLDLKDPKEFIERWSVGNDPLGEVQSLAREDAKSVSPAWGNPVTETDKDYVLYVHGYNMQEFEKQRWIETTFKRLYWLGYKGRVGGFTWPCSQTAAPYDASEERAWQSATKLKDLLSQLRAAGYRVHLLAHSQGNVVAGEALRQWKEAGNTSALVRTYIASQAAIQAHCYDAAAPLIPGFAGSATDSGTPNVYANYPATSAPYMGADSMSGAAVKWVNFENPGDYALTGNSIDPLDLHPGWQANQRLKPDEEFGYDPTLGFFDSRVSSLSPLNLPQDRFTIFAYCAEGRSLALGSTETGGVFAGNNTDLEATLGYGLEHRYHSAQFRSFMSERYRYWQLLMQVADLTP